MHYRKQVASVKEDHDIHDDIKIEGHDERRLWLGVNIEYCDAGGGLPTVNGPTVLRTKIQGKVIARSASYVKCRPGRTKRHW